MKNKKMMITICVALLVLIAGGTAIGAILHNKTDKYTRVIKAYENTVNADSFICDFYMDLNGDYDSYEVEVYGKNDNTVLSNLDNGRVYYALYNGYCYRNVAEKVDSQYIDFMKIVAERDIAGMYAYFQLDEFLGIRYDQLYKSGIEFIKDYFTNKEKLDFVDGVSIEDDEYIFSIYFKDFVSWMEDNNNFKAPSEYKDSVLQDTKLTVKLSLDGKFIKDINLRIFTKKEDFMTLSARFTKVNEITDSNSLGIQHIKEIDNKKK